MKIEIEVELDEKEWEYLGISHPENGDKYLWNDNLCEWNYGDNCTIRYPTFRRRKNWKDRIVWPRMLKKGWIARNINDNVYWYKSKPIESGEYMLFDYNSTDGKFHSINWPGFDLSFLPEQFWKCHFKESLCEVKHGN